MMAGVFSSRIAHWSVGVCLGVIFLAIVGCDNTYPKDLQYPPRSDLLVVKAPTEEPVYPDSPGQLDRLIAGIKSKQGETLNPKDLSGKDRQELTKELDKAFGTPAVPKVSSFDDSDAGEAVTELQLESKALALGSKLYRRHCLHCHGLPGDGRGPSGAWLNPHPRDYRQGLFKFMSSTGGENRKPRRADILRIVHNGIEGTSMPAFNAIPEGHDGHEALVSYVIHLSIRGEVEYNTIQTIVSKGELKDDSIAGNVEELTKTYLGRWRTASSESGLMKPGSNPSYTDKEWQESVVRGYEAFVDEKGEASCIKCHSDYGRQVNFRYDRWGTLVRPANLTTGVYRGGRRPIDLYWRVKGGIVPSGMPAAAALSEERTWDVVNFLQALPHPRMLPEKIRARIYVREQPKQVAAK